MNLLPIQQEIIELVDANQFEDHAKFLGRGEFSDVFLYKNLAIKISHDVSLHNPNNYTKEKFLAHSNKTLREELDTYQLIQPNSILPNPFYLFEHAGHVYIIREVGEIDLQEEEILKFLPKWKRGSIKLQHYQELVDQLYFIAKKFGKFEDLLQIAKRTDGSLFIYDLGYFNPDLVKDDLIYRYWWLEHKISILNDQVGLTPKLPEYVIEDHISHYQQEYADALQNYGKEIANVRYGKNLRKWEELKKECADQNWCIFDFN